jgi:hypothetical protein
MNISMKDDGAVVVSSAGDNFWIFSTITAPRPGEHPVSGHRLFSLRKGKGADAYEFRITGVDRPTNYPASFAASVADIPYNVADWLWTGLIEVLAKKIEAAKGKVVRRRSRYWARHSSANIDFYVRKWHAEGKKSIFNAAGPIIIPDII